MLEVKQEVAPWIDLQIVAFPQEGILSYPNGEALLEEALRLGADVVGAIPHFEFTREYGVESLHKTFALAQKYDRLIDVHCDEIDDEQSRLTVSSMFTVTRLIMSNHALSKPFLPWRTVKAWARESPPATLRQCTPITGRIPHVCSAC